METADPATVTTNGADKVLVNEYDPARRYEPHPLIHKEHGRVSDEEFTIWAKALVVAQIEMAARFMPVDRRVQDQIAEKIMSGGAEAVSSREYSYWEGLRKAYSLDKMLGTLVLMDKLGRPEDGNSGSVNVTVNINQESVDSVEAKRAAAQKLLRDFNASDKYIGEDRQLIEGSVIGATE